MKDGFGPFPALKKSSRNSPIIPRKSTPEKKIPDKKMDSRRRRDSVTPFRQDTSSPNMDIEPLGSTLGSNNALIMIYESGDRLAQRKGHHVMDE